MAICWRVVEMPDGSIEILKPPSDRARRNAESDEDFCRRVYEETMGRPGIKYAGRPFADIDPASVPSDRSQRHAWRLRDGRIVVDPTVPPPPHPKQDLLDAIDRAHTVDDLKAALRKVLGA